MHIDQETMKSWGLHPTDQTDQRLLNMPDGTSDEEFIPLLEEIAEYDDYAKEMLARARAQGVGASSTNTPE